MVVSWCFIQAMVGPALANASDFKCDDDVEEDLDSEDENECDIEEEVAGVQEENETNPVKLSRSQDVKNNLIHIIVGTHMFI